MSKKKSEAKPELKPLVTFAGDKKTVMELLFHDNPELCPAFSAVALIKLPLEEPYNGRFVSVKLKVKGKEVLEIEHSEPDFKAIALDDCKINFETLYMSGDDNDLSAR